MFRVVRISDARYNINNSIVYIRGLSVDWFYVIVFHFARRARRQSRRRLKSCCEIRLNDPGGLTSVICEPTGEREMLLIFLTSTGDARGMVMSRENTPTE